MQDPALWKPRLIDTLDIRTTLVMPFLMGHLNLFCPFEISIRFRWNACVAHSVCHGQEKLQLCWICSSEVNFLLCLCFFSFVECKLHWFQFVGQLGLFGSENICLKQRSKGGWDETHRKLTDQFNCCEMWSASFLHPNCFLHTPTQTTAMQTSQLKIGKEGALNYKWSKCQI